MKKTIITSLLLILTLQSAFAECSIKDSSADVLKDYIWNLRKVVSKVTSDLWQNWSDKSTITKIEQDFIRGINRVIDFDWYYSSFEFTVLQLTNEVPYEIKRDRNLLKNELTYLQNYLERIVRRWYANNSIKDVCSWLENCTLSWNWQQVITELIKNTSKIITLYENSILGDSTTFSNSDFILVWPNFKDEFVKSYNKQILMDCSSSEWWFWDRASKSMEKISLDSQYMKDATKKWIEAWDLLTWKISKEEERQMERDLLRKELSRQWIPANQAQVIMDNLERYNQEWWFSAWNNFFTNSFNSIASAGWKFISTFWSFISWIADLWKSIWSMFSSDSNWWVSTEFINTETSSKDNTKLMFEKMQKLYAEEQLYAWQEVIIDEKIVDELIDLHINLSNIAKTLDWTVENSENACKEQSVWEWNCDDY